LPGQNKAGWAGAAISRLGRGFPVIRSGQLSSVPAWPISPSAPAGLAVPAGPPPRTARVGQHLPRLGWPILAPLHSSAPAPRFLRLGPSGRLLPGRIFLAGAVSSQAGLRHHRSPLAGIAWPGSIPSIPGWHFIDRETAPDILAPGRHARSLAASEHPALLLWLDRSRWD
jgi:hypothetical protein